MMKKRWLGAVVFSAVLVVTSLGAAIPVSAHGYVSYPESRVYLANKGINKNVGAAQWEPQSIEAPKGFPESGPADGQIAGGGKYPALDEQSADRWAKVNIPSGDIDFTWTLTAPHRTSAWKYYITKIGWNPDAPLTRDALEPLAYIPADGSVPQTQVTQTITIPNDREGYYIILGVWDIADTANAFYQVIDANIINDSLPDALPPSQPQNLGQKSIAPGSAVIQWQAATDNRAVKHYEVLRDNQVIGTTATLEYQDDTVVIGATYTYTIRAVDYAGNRSAASAPLSVLVPQVMPEDKEAPVKPCGLKAQEVTERSIMLHWHATNDNVGTAYYQIYRGGKLIGTSTTPMFTDKNLQPSTSYSYQVVAVDAAGNRSASSNALSVTTKTAAIPPIADGSWNSQQIYTAGMSATYNGRTYKAKWWTKGNNPETSDVWQYVSGPAPIWNRQRAYNANDVITYNGKTYQAKWWTKGNTPDTSSVWVLKQD